MAESREGEEIGGGSKEKKGGGKLWKGWERYWEVVEGGQQTWGDVGWQQRGVQGQQGVMGERG